MQAPIGIQHAWMPIRAHHTACRVHISRSREMHETGPNTSSRTLPYRIQAPLAQSPAAGVLGSVALPARPAGARARPHRGWCWPSTARARLPPTQRAQGVPLATSVHRSKHRITSTNQHPMGMGTRVTYLLCRAHHKARVGRHRALRNPRETVPNNVQVAAHATPSARPWFAVCSHRSTRFFLGGGVLVCDS